MQVKVNVMLILASMIIICAIWSFIEIGIKVKKLNKIKDDMYNNK